MKGCVACCGACCISASALAHLRRMPGGCRKFHQGADLGSSVLVARARETAAASVEFALPTAGIMLTLTRNGAGQVPCSGPKTPTGAGIEHVTLPEDVDGCAWCFALFCGVFRDFGGARRFFRLCITVLHAWIRAQSASSVACHCSVLYHASCACCHGVLGRKRCQMSAGPASRDAVTHEGDGASAESAQVS